MKTTWQAKKFLKRNFDLSSLTTFLFSSKPPPPNFLLLLALFPPPLPLLSLCFLHSKAEFPGLLSNAFQAFQNSLLFLEKTKLKRKMTKLTSLLFLALVLFAGLLSSPAQAADVMTAQTAIAAKPKLACECFLFFWFPSNVNLQIIASDVFRSFSHDLFFFSKKKKILPANRKMLWWGGGWNNGWNNGGWGNNWW